MNHQAHQGHQECSYPEPSEHLDAIARQIVDSCFCVHKDLGPGLLESAYGLFLFDELKERGLDIRREVPLTVTRKNRTIDMAYRLDLLVENEIIIELKTVEKILPIHQAQMMTYLKLSQKKLGFLVNFNNKLIKDGIKRFVI